MGPKHIFWLLHVFLTKTIQLCFPTFAFFLLFPLSFPYSPGSVAASRPRAIHVRERMARTGLRARGRSGGLSFAVLPS